MVEPIFICVIGEHAGLYRRPYVFSAHTVGVIDYFQEIFSREKLRWLQIPCSHQGVEIDASNVILIVDIPIPVIIFPIPTAANLTTANLNIRTPVIDVEDQLEKDKIQTSRLYALCRGKTRERFLIKIE